MKDFRGNESGYGQSGETGDRPDDQDYYYSHYGPPGFYPFGFGFYPPPTPWGGWWGSGYGYSPPPPEFVQMMKQQERRFLEYRLEMLRREMEAIEQRLKEIDSE